MVFLYLQMKWFFNSSSIILIKKSSYLSCKRNELIGYIWTKAGYFIDWTETSDHCESPVGQIIELEITNNLEKYI